jgi:hypothetical protein
MTIIVLRMEYTSEFARDVAQLLSALSRAVE